jgi:hypothetical protein
MIPTVFFLIAAALKFDGAISTPWTVLLILWLLGAIFEFMWVMND